MLCIFNFKKLYSSATKDLRINLRHLAHVGWDQDGGLQRMVDQEPMDDSVRDLLRAAGQNPDCINNDEIKFVYKFLEDFNAGKQSNSPLPVNTYQSSHNSLYQGYSLI